MASSSADSQLQDLLQFVKTSRGFDFTGYKRTTLQRRIEKRLQAVGCEDYARYQDHLEVNPAEFTELFNTVLINVTSFFRDEAAWDFLRTKAIPQLLEDIPENGQIRVWSAGCASGEEAYTTAIVLAEALGEEEYRQRVKIYATDVDEESLAAARQGFYSQKSVSAVPDELVDKYFEANSRGLAFRPELRRSIIFGRNDLVLDAPISRIDLLVCRNVLMYFTAEAQARILERFNFALNPSGFLFMGKSEMLVMHADLFAPHDMKARVFRKVPRNNIRDRLPFVPPGTAEGVTPERALTVRSGAAALAPIAQIAIDRNGTLADANLRARELFGIGGADLGRPLQDLSLSYRPADLRTAIETAYETRDPVPLGRVPWMRAAGDERVLDIGVTPVPGPGNEPLGVTVTFDDVTALTLISGEYERAKVELESAYEELQSTVEELETTNEELQSTNEELETTNEELQSTNEELETMNEELQSTNDELETMNGEINSRAGELDRVNLFFEGILSGLGVGVIVIDVESQVQVWNVMSMDLWGLRADEVVGHDLMSLDFGFPVERLGQRIAAIIGGKEESVEEKYDAVDRRGRGFECMARVMALRTRAGDVYGAMILMAPEGELSGTIAS